MQCATEPAARGAASRAGRFPTGRAGAALGVGITILLQACTGEQVTEVTIGSVTVRPPTVNLVAGEDVRLEATVHDADGQELPGAMPEWSSGDPAVASVDESGLVRAFTAGTVDVRATYGDVSGGSTVRVIAGPGVALSSDSVAMYAAATASDPRPEIVHVTNEGTGALEGLEVSVRHPDGSPAWLSAELASTSAPTSVTLAADIDGLGPGVHRATAVVGAPSLGGTTVEVPVTLRLLSIAVEPTAGSTIVSEAGSRDTLMVRLGAQPPAEVALTVASEDPEEASVQPTRLTFSAATWDAPQQVTVIGTDDVDADGIVTVAIRFAVDPAASADEVDDLPPLDIAVRSVDDDQPAIVVTETGGGTVVAESGGTDEVAVGLTARPSSDVVITVGSGDAGEATASPATLRFGPDDWSTRRTITVRGVDDGTTDGDQETVLTFAVDAAASHDAWDGVSAVALSVTTTDDDVSGVSVVESGGATVVSEAGATDAFTVALTSQPATNVVVVVAGADPSEASVAPLTLTFTPSDWSGPKTVTVTGVDDALPDGDLVTGVTIAVDAASSDDAYDPVAPRSIAVTTTDDDVAGFTVTQSGGGTVVTEDGDGDDVTIALTAQPTVAVVLAVSSADVGETTATPERLTFTPADWNVAQTVTFTGVDDFVDDGSQTTVVTFTVDDAASDAAFDGVGDQTVAVTTTDNDDPAGISVVEIGGTEVDESGSTDAFAVSLAAQPATNVVLTVTSGDVSEATVETATLTFTSADWSTARTVTVRGVDDGVTDGDQVTPVTVAVDPAASDAAYDAVAPSIVSVTTTDDEIAGLAITESAGATAVSEAGSTDAFTVALIAQPVSGVVLTVTAADPGEATVVPATLAFTPADWSTPRTLTVTGVDDALADGDQTSAVTVAVDPAASDDAFDALPPATVAVTTSDDDLAGVRVLESGGSTVVGEDGGTDQVTVVLTAQPTIPVVLSVTSADIAEAAASPLTLTFTPGSWNVAQTVTITGVDDLFADGTRSTTITFAVVDFLSDDAFDAVPDQAIVVTTTDNDGPAGLPPVVSARRF